MRIGGNYLGNGKCEFTVWAPFAENVAVKLFSPERSIPLAKQSCGYWKATVEKIHPGTCYLYSLDNTLERPDPASHFQPQGVHGPSQIIDHHSFQWHDSCYRGMDLAECILYELHVGTFTPEGTFAAIIPRLDELQQTGINALELMPVGQFPGERNWGYDGAYPFAVQNSYGGPQGLKNLVDSCHGRNMPVILDVVYNHFGPEGSYCADYGPYFTNKYKTPWGNAVNFDDAYCDEVRNYFIQNALFWFKEYHIDALRLDAIHAIYDMSAQPFLQELASKVEEFCRHKQKKHYLIAESDLNDSRVVRPRSFGGFGMDAQWCDDFHHSLHTLLVGGNNQGYYKDFGTVGDMAKAFREGFVYSGQYSAYRKKRFGNSSLDVPARRFIVFSQNHDQVGNRLFGERLSSLVPFEALKLAACAVILSPYIPLLFMGEEYGDTAPFLYFVSHSDRKLIEAVAAGRKNEFKEFGYREDFLDPESISIFQRSKLSWNKREEGQHKILLHFYQRLIGLRRAIPALSAPCKHDLEAHGLEEGNTLYLKRWNGTSEVIVLFNFGKDNVQLPCPRVQGTWDRLIDTADREWQGPGSVLPDTLDGAALTLHGYSAAVYEKKVQHE